MGFFMSVHKFDIAGLLLPGIKKQSAVPFKNDMRIRGDEVRKMLIQQIWFVSAQQKRAGWIDIEYETVAVEGKISHRGKIEKIRVSSPGTPGGRLIFLMG
jgi:hypothetical protein